MRGLASILVLAACTGGTLPAGAVCEQGDQCDDGLACLDLGQFSGTTCTVVGKVCSRTCEDDAGCADLGANFRCFAGCGTEKICGEVATP